MKQHESVRLGLVGVTMMGAASAVAQNEPCFDSAWTLRAAGGATPDYGLQMVYDQARGVTLLFGGNQGPPIDAFFAWDCHQWAPLNPDHRPPARDGHAMIFDSSRNVAVVFGGYNGQTETNDTWEWDGTDWALKAEDGPSKRTCRMAFDSKRHVALLFGGSINGNGGPFYNDTWQWDGAAWVQVAVEGPPGRGGYTMSYDPVRDRTVLFGGWTGTYESLPLFNETWEWDGSAWRKVADDGPSPRICPWTAFDPALGEVVLYGGSTGPGVYSEETWTWNGQRWRVVDAPSPPARYNHGMSYDSGRGVIVMFGGHDTGGLRQDTWEWKIQTADLNGDGSFDLFDFLAFVNLFNEQDPGADCDDNCEFDLFDFLCFTNEFNAGC